MTLNTSSLCVFVDMEVAAPAASPIAYDSPIAASVLCSTTPSLMHCAHVNVNRPSFSFKYQQVCAKAFANEQWSAVLSFK